MIRGRWLRNRLKKYGSNGTSLYVKDHRHRIAERKIKY
jgi:hypothetical protein